MEKIYFNSVMFHLRSEQKAIFKKACPSREFANRSFVD